MPLGGAQFVKFMTGNEGLHGTLNYFMHNVGLFLNEGAPTEKNQRLQITVLTLAAGIWTLAQLKKAGLRSLQKPEVKAFSITFYILFAFVFATLTMYLVGSQADYRILSAPFLFSVCVLLSLDFKWLKYLIVFFVCLNLNIFSQYLQNYKEFREPLYTFDKTKYVKLNNEVEGVLKFRPEANSWCNTIVSGGLEPWVYTEFAALPAGFGIQTVWKWAYLNAPLKSAYLILDKRSVEGKPVETRPHMEIVNKDGANVQLKIDGFGLLNLKQLAELDLDNKLILFANLDSHCQ
jgi:hypothetical protein